MFKYSGSVDGGVITVIVLVSERTGSGKNKSTFALLSWRTCIIIPRFKPLYRIRVTLKDNCITSVT